MEDVCDRVAILYGGKVQAMGTLHELLAKPDTVRITVPPLPKETMQRVLELIRHDVAADKVRIDTPTQNLESYFLGVVERARESAETSGATSGSRVAAYLRGDAEIKEPKQRRAIQKRKLSIYGASEHNLKAIDVEIPLDMLVCVTGVSGSGKSTLIHDCIYAGLKKQRGDWQGHVGAFQRVEGGQLIDDVILVDQSPIGRTPRSNPVTYIKVYDAIREAFAGTREAQEPAH